jgi:hypothetical protein
METNRALIDLDAIPTLFDHRVAPVRELHALGMSTHAIYERCRPGGPWQRLEPNLVLLTDEPPNRTQRVHGALKAAGRDAVLSGVDALKLHGMSGAKLTSPVHILMPVSRRQPGLVDGVYFERTHQLPEPLFLGGFPVAPLPRATVDTCRRIKHAAFITEVLSETIRKGRITPATLRDEMERVRTAAGVTLARKQLAMIDDQVRSVAQGWAKRLVRDAGLPAPNWRVPITTPNGNHVATADVWWDEVALAWEVDSYAFDLSPADAVAALARAARLTASGVLVVHTTPTELRDDPAAVADLLRGAYQRAAARPRPEVHAQCLTPPKPYPSVRLKPSAKPTTPDPNRTQQALLRLELETGQENPRPTHKEPNRAQQNLQHPETPQEPQPEPPQKPQPGTPQELRPGTPQESRPEPLQEPQSEPSPVPQPEPSKESQRPQPQQP